MLHVYYLLKELVRLIFLVQLFLLFLEIALGRFLT